MFKLWFNYVPGCSNVREGCWWKMHVCEKHVCLWKTFTKIHLLNCVMVNNVGEKVCWRKKICSFKIKSTLVNYVCENFSVCWQIAFSLAVLKLVKDIGEKCMLVKFERRWKLSPTSSFYSNIYANIMSVKIIQTVSLTYN